MVNDDSNETSTPISQVVHEEWFSLAMDKIGGYDWDAIYIGKKKNIWKLEEVLSTWTSNQLWIPRNSLTTNDNLC